MYDVTPGQVYRETGRWIGPAIIVTLAVLLVGGIATLVCWQAGWWFAQRDVNRQNQLYQGSVAVQQADIGSMENVIGAIASAADSAQANADAQQACRYAAQITSIPPADAGWVAQNCLAGAVAPGSQYAK
jgi:hypothetical protein